MSDDDNIVQFPAKKQEPEPPKLLRGADGKLYVEQPAPEEPAEDAEE